MVQWLKFCTPNAGGPGQSLVRTRCHMLQLRVCLTQLKVPHAATKTWSSQINKYILWGFFVFFFNNLSWQIEIPEALVSKPSLSDEKTLFESASGQPKDPLQRPEPGFPFCHSYSPTRRSKHQPQEGRRKFGRGHLPHGLTSGVLLKLVYCRAC